MAHEQGFRIDFDFKPTGGIWIGDTDAEAGVPPTYTTAQVEQALLGLNPRQWDAKATTQLRELTGRGDLSVHVWSASPPSVTVINDANPPAEWWLIK